MRLLTGLLSKTAVQNKIMQTKETQLHKTINHPSFPNCFEHITVANQTICTSRQLKFKTLRTNTRKIGMNMIANKIYCISNQIGLDLLNLSFVHFKKLAKIQFLKYGKT